MTKAATSTETLSTKTQVGSVNDIKNQIKSIESEAKQKVAALRKQLQFIASGFKEGDTLKSTLDSRLFKVTGSNDDGLVGTMIYKDSVIKESEYKDWRKV